MTDPLPERTEDKKAKSKALDRLYKWYLEKRSYDWIKAELARNDLPRMSSMEWNSLQHFFRQKEMSTPGRMATIRRKIGVRA